MLDWLNTHTHTQNDVYVYQEKHGKNIIYILNREKYFDTCMIYCVLSI